MESLVSDLASYPSFPDPLPIPLSLAERERSISHEGGLSRLRCLLAKLRQGKNVTMAVLGGSVSAGSSSRVRPDQSGLFHRKLHRWLQRRYPNAHIHHINAAMPAVPPGYMEQCLSLHVPPHTDLVLLEASANMCGKARQLKQSYAAGDAADPCEAGRESVERMLRQVLRFPSHPAVVLVHAFPFWTMETPKSWYQKKGPRGRAVVAPPLSSASDLAFDFHRQWGHTANEDAVRAAALAAVCSRHNAALGEGARVVDAVDRAEGVGCAVRRGWEGVGENKWSEREVGERAL